MTSLPVLLFVAFVVSLSAALSVRPACTPSPCGPYSKCIVSEDKPVCSCLDGFSGNPPTCHTTCEVDSDCSPTYVCKSQQCRDPCDGACNQTGVCDVRGRIPVCTYPPPTTETPIMEELMPPRPSIELNLTPPEIPTVPERYACTTHPDCGPDKGCINEKCVNPCSPAVCGVGADCRVFNHSPVCSCPPGHTGNPFVKCDPQE